MKRNIISKIPLAFCFLPFYQCMLFNREDCQDNLGPYFYETITYKNNEVVEFVNDSGDLESYTVHIEYPDVPDRYVEDGTDQTHFACEGQFKVTLGEYEIRGQQEGNIYNNTIDITVSLYTSGPFEYEKIDTINYLYNDSLIKSIHYYEYKMDKYCLDCDSYVIEYYVSVADLRLLYYSIYENDTITNWRLK